MATRTETSLVCPLCKQEGSKVVLTGVREDAEKPVFECAYCRLRFLPTPDYDLYEYYRSEYRNSHRSILNEEHDPDAQFKMMRPLMAERLRRFKAVVPTGSTVLEVGCSSGYFLDALSEDYTVFGNEWNPADAAYVRNTLGLPCSEDKLEDAFPGKKFTAICAFQVIEHVPDPMAWLRLVKERLIGGGWIYLQTPNLDGALLSIYDIPEYQSRYYRNPHLLYFNIQNLAGALGTVGFEARVVQQQEYSFGNHLWWLFRDEPMESKAMGEVVFLPVAKEHPAAGVLNRWFAAQDRQYRAILDTLKACDQLIGFGRKREI